MDTAAGDSYSVSSTSQLIERRHFGTSFVWKIVQVQHRISGKSDKIVSPLFRCSNASWQLILCGGNDHYGSSLSLLLSCIALSSPNFNVYVKCVILDDKGNNLFEVSGKKLTFCTHSNYRENIFINMKMITGMTINFSVIMEEDFTPTFPLKEAKKVCLVEKKNDTPEKKDADRNTSTEDFHALDVEDGPTTEKGDIVDLLNDIEALYNNPRFADVILRLGEHEFPAHKLVLRSRSKVFEAMFEHDMQENRQDTIDLVDMDIDTVKDMLRYIYCGKTRQLSSEEALNLYVAADRYDLRGLVVKCRKSLLNQLSINNICEISAVADLHNDKLLMDAVKSLLSKDMKEIFKTDKWVMFAKENQSLSFNLIQSAVLNC